MSTKCSMVIANAEDFSIISTILLICIQTYGFVLLVDRLVRYPRR